jgi:uncharacterized protein (TIGR00369 family)
VSGLDEYLNSWLAGVIEPPVTRLVGIHLQECAGGSAMMEMEAGERHHNPMGTVHGGVLCDLADAAMGAAMASTLLEDESFSTVELHMNYFRPVRSERLTARGAVLNRTRRTAYLECEITGQDGRSIARGSSVCLVNRQD